MKTIQLLHLAILVLFTGMIAQAQTVTVLTYNIHHGTDKDEIDQLQQMGQFIRQSGVDLVGLQEVDSVCRRSGGVDQMKKLGEITGMHYAFVRHFAYQGGAYGQGILSRYPISEIKNNRLTLLKKDSTRESLALISAVVTFPRKKNILFASAHFALDEATRMIQASETVALFASRDMPVIFTGDLNATPEKNEIRYLDTLFTTTDPAHHLTYPADKPVKSIDYIFVNTAYFDRVLSFKVPDVNYSDHRPAMSTFELSMKKKTK